MLSRRHLRILALRSVKEFGDDNCSQMAAAISYYVLFSLFPLLIFSTGIIGLVLQDSALQEDVIDAILENIPLSEEEGRNDVSAAVEGVAGVGSGALGLLGLIGMAWSGSNMFGVIRRSLNIAYDLEVHRPIVRQKLVDLGMVLAFAPFFILSLAATAALRFAQQASDDVTFFGDLSQALGPAWTAASFVLPVGFSFAAFGFLYWFVPATRVRPRDVWLGALIAAILFEVTKVGFSIYLQNFSNYDVVFGSLGAIVAFLFWLFLGANILLAGAEIASEYPRVMRGDYDEEKPDSDAPALTPGKKVRAFLCGLFVHEHERASEDEAEESAESSQLPPPH